MSRDYVLHSFRAPIDLQIDYAKELNEQQHAAVTAVPGPALVIAGAGSGKTRTLTYRVAFLLEQGIPPERMLLLTFTNKAAREMMRRVSDLLGHELAALWGGTFHSIGNRVLRQHAPLLGYQRDFSILDREDAEHLLKTCLAEANIDVKKTRFPKAEVLAEIFGLAVNTGKIISQILGDQFGEFISLEPQILDLQRRYAERKRNTNTMDFDDLLALWLRLMQEHEEVRELYQRRFQFVLVDEYQDTNKLQSSLIDLLAARHHNLMVVGDDAQSIYAWRGANFRNILEFPKRYPEAKVYKIETNYRSSPEILQVANAAIRANEQQFAKELASARKSGTKPALVVCGDATQQAQFVAQRALELREEGVALDKMAVLYRSHFHALELQLELTRHNIPFSITSGIRFFEQAHIKDLTAYLKLVHNPRDELSFKRLALMLPGVGAKAAHKLWLKMMEAGGEPPAKDAKDAKGADESTSERDLPMAPDPPNETNPARGGNPDAEAVFPLPGEKDGVRAGLHSSNQPLAVLLSRCTGAVPKKAAAAWAQFIATISQLEARGVRDSAAKMIELALEAGYEDYLKENYANHASRLDDLEQLAVFARQFQAVEDFLTQLALLTNVEAEAQDRPNRNDEQLRLSTIHQAKGLEFDVVFVIMLCEGLFPSNRSLVTAEGIEEERRLMYVAITRARNELYLSYPLVRAGFGGGGDFFQLPSRFLGEIPKELVDEWNLRLH